MRTVKKIVERVGIAPQESIINRRLYLNKKFGEICIMFNDDCVIDCEKGTLDATGQVVKVFENLSTDLVKEGLTDKAFMTDGPVDSRLHLWTIEDTDGGAIASIARVNAHAVTATQSRIGKKISSDFVGPMSGIIHSDTGAPCLVFNGAFGNTRPLQEKYCFEECDRIAGLFAETMLNADPKQSITTSISGVSLPCVGLPLRKDFPHSREELKKIVEKKETGKKEAWELKRDNDRKSTAEILSRPGPPQETGVMLEGELDNGVVNREWQAWCLGPLKILCLPGEPFVQLCESIEKKTGFLTVGISNGYMSYLPDPESLLNGGYEANQCLLDGDTLRNIPEYAKKLCESLKVD
jgi:hypothetical protein